MKRLAFISSLTVFLALTSVCEPADAALGDWIKKKTKQVQEQIQKAADQTAKQINQGIKGQKPDDQSSAILEAQQLLNQLGYNAGAPDGVIGPGTRRAITAYRDNNGLPMTATVDTSLLKSLRASVSSQDTSAEPVASSKAPNTSSSGGGLLSATSAGKAGQAADEALLISSRTFTDPNGLFKPIEISTYKNIPLISSDHASSGFTAYFHFLGASMINDPSKIVVTKRAPPIFMNFLEEARQEKYVDCRKGYNGKRNCLGWHGARKTSEPENEFQLQRSVDAFKSDMLRPIVEHGKNFPRTLYFSGSTRLFPYDQAKKGFPLSSASNLTQGGISFSWQDSKYRHLSTGVPQSLRIPTNYNTIIPVSAAQAESLLSKLEQRRVYWLLKANIKEVKGETIAAEAESITLFEDRSLTTAITQLRQKVITPQPKPRKEVNSIFPNHERLVGHVARAGLDANQVSGLLGRLNEFERREKLKKFQDKLDDAGSQAPLSSANVIMELVLGEYDFESKSFKVNKVNTGFYVSRYSENFDYRGFLPQANLVNIQSLSRLLVDEEVARVIVEQYGRRLSGIAEVELGDARKTRDHQIYTKRGLGYSVDVTAKQITVLKNRVEARRFNGESKDVLGSISVGVHSGGSRLATGKKGISTPSTMTVQLVELDNPEFPSGIVGAQITYSGWITPEGVVRGLSGQAAEQSGDAAAVFNLGVKAIDTMRFQGLQGERIPVLITFEWDRSTGTSRLVDITSSSATIDFSASQR